jgi:hypothetical protein
LLAAVRLVQVEADVGHFRLLPYPAALYTLARFFHVHPSPHPVTRTRLARWFWRAAVTSAFGRPAASRWRDSVRAIDSDEHASMDRLMRGLPARPDARWALSRFDGRLPTSRMEVLALLSLGPLPMPRADLFREGPVETAEIVGRDRLASEVFLGAHAEDDRALAKTAANRVLLEVSLARSGSTQLPSDPDSPFFASHAIPPEAAEALRRRDKAAFLRSRADALVDVVEAFLERHAGWDELDLPPLDTFLEEE